MKAIYLVKRMEDEKATMLWNKLFEMIKLITGEVDVAHRGDLQTQVDTLSETVSECFTSVGDGKKDMANAITGKGVSTEADATFATMADNIRKIKTNPTLQNKSAALHTGATSVVMKPDEGYDGLSQATANITLQEKTAALSTVAQEITPDSGKVLSKVKVPAVTGNAETSHVLSGKTFSSGNGVNKTGVMANQGAWKGETTGSGNVVIPAGYHNGGGYVSGKGAYDAGYSDGQNAAGGNYQSGYDAGVAATKVGNAEAGNVLDGKTFTNANSVGASGSMPNKGAWTGETTGSGNVTIPEGYHNGQGYVSGKGAYDAGYSAGQAAASVSSANITYKNMWTDISSGKSANISFEVPANSIVCACYGWAATKGYAAAVSNNSSNITLTTQAMQDAWANLRVFSCHGKTGDTAGTFKVSFTGASNTEQAHYAFCRAWIIEDN